MVAYNNPTSSKTFVVFCSVFSVVLFIIHYSFFNIIKKNCVPTVVSGVLQRHACFFTNVNTPFLCYGNKLANEY